MDIKTLQQFIEQHESSTLEFKKSTGQLTSAAATICAFLNNNGGTVLIGITNNAKLVGQDITDNTLLEIANTLRKFEPTANIDVGYIEIGNGKKVIKLTAYPDPSSVPYAFDGKPYERKESSTSIMPQGKYQQLLLSKNLKPTSWEMLPATELSISDLDHNEITQTVKDIVRKKRLETAFDTANIAEILTRLQLIDSSNNITNAAAVLFSKEISGHYGQCILKMARFKGLTKLRSQSEDDKHIIDIKHITGNAFNLLNEAEIFINRNTAIASYFVKGQMARVDVPEYPVEPVREALINAICHRDYTSLGGSISIFIFDDRLEIHSIGLLAPGITLEQLKTFHASHPRNPKIMNVFFRRGFIESMGVGTQDIIRPYIDASEKEPEFYEQAGYFVVKLWSRHYEPKIKASTSDLSDRQQQILKLLKAENNIATEKLQASLEVSESTLRRELKALKEAGLIREKKEGTFKFWNLIKR